MKKRIASSKFSIVLLTVVLLWLKTYLIYRLDFDIGMNSFLEQFNLFINPASTLFLLIGTVFIFAKNEEGVGYWQRASLIHFYCTLMYCTSAPSMILLQCLYCL
ncbi:hypothetical protein [Litoribacterium kuwaitense]|uniref:hypothetical protein n=1 Tax=Litoribacterium kuwaitense TaxID=1398745 RepID=UPI0028AB371E|nr:hypothetical protein [Litoribacterium kuwaitense]